MTPILCTGNVSTVALQRSFHKDTLKISSLSKWASSESRYEPPCAKLASCSLERHYTVLLTNSCSAATRFLRTPIKADTKSIGRVFVERTLECHCRNLNEHKSSKESYLYFLQILRFWISRPQSRSRLGSHARGSQPLAGSHPRNAKHEPRFIRR